LPIRGRTGRSLTRAPIGDEGIRALTRGLRVVAVVVSWNRRDLLAESLAAINGQARRPDAVVVVDNASTDGTPEFVDGNHPEVDLIQLDTNIGGAGGFSVGLTRALALRADLVWLMDDDTVPEPSALEELIRARQAYRGHSPVLIASKVVWTDGRDHPMNTPRPKPGVREAEREAAALVDCVPIRSASFVSILVDAGEVRRHGLPLADYFLWNDDFEFTTRLLRHGPGLYCPASVVVHKTRTFGSTAADPGERFFLEVRNKVWLFTRSRGLKPAERAVYLGSTVRRWARTFAASHDRVTLAKGLGNGLLTGLRHGPRPTDEVLTAAGIDLSTGARR
jgi:rhamnopyranosyl-N-acetylglucosaminyl-diphospho-decaprenol beta-1,3/1,4-galactofuranosyltransferase